MRKPEYITTTSGITIRASVDIRRATRLDCLAASTQSAQLLFCVNPVLCIAMVCATGAAAIWAIQSGGGKVIPFPSKPKTETCEKDDCSDDPCTELLVALKVRFLQMVARAGSGIDVTFELRQYEAARAEFCKVCPAICSQAPKIPGQLQK